MKWNERVNEKARNPGKREREKTLDDGMSSRVLDTLSPSSREIYLHELPQFPVGLRRGWMSGLDQGMEQKQAQEQHMTLHLVTLETIQIVTINLPVF